MDEGAEKLARKVKGEVTGVAAGIKDAATGLTHQAQRAATTQLASTKDKAADSLGSIASALRTTAERLDESDEGGFVNEYVETAASKVDDVADYVRHRKFGQMVSDLEGFARREPALFLGGGLVLGLVVGRFFKSSRTAVARLSASEKDSFSRPSDDELEGAR
ncbi:MAG: hypothetical protein Q8S33_01845 [Myxococcales bacterium]|nr:hypothetical protein [Myxococcales bacterium]MDP3499038.1 hypothetical protein [Myxococcales bacterium]